MSAKLSVRTALLLRGQKWAAFDRSQQPKYNWDPRWKSVVMTEEGEQLARELFARHFKS